LHNRITIANRHHILYQLRRTPYRLTVGNGTIMNITQYSLLSITYC